MTAVLVSGITACGYKGKLRTPAQIEADEQRKARKAAKEERKVKKEAPASAQDSVIEQAPPTSGGAEPK